MTSRTLGKNGVFTQQLHAQLKAVHGHAVFADTHIAGGHAFDGTVIGVQNFRAGKAGEYFHTQGFSLFGQPFGHGAQADDVVAVVVGKRWQDHIGHAKARFFAQKHVGVVGYWLGQWSA